MSVETVIALGRSALELTLALAGPVLLFGLVAGLAVSVLPAPAGALGGESARGVLVGLVAQFIFAGVELGAQLAGSRMGFGIANLIGPTANAQVTVVAQWQQLLALLVFLVLDIHHLLLRALLESFRSAPPGGLALGGIGLGGTVALAGQLFTLGVRVAAPVLVALLLTN